MEEILILYRRKYRQGDEGLPEACRISVDNFLIENIIDALLCLQISLDILRNLFYAFKQNFSFYLHPLSKHVLSQPCLHRNAQVGQRIRHYGTLALLSHEIAVSGQLGNSQSHGDLADII